MRSAKRRRAEEGRERGRGGREERGRGGKERADSPLLERRVISDETVRVRNLVDLVNLSCQFPFSSVRPLYIEWKHITNYDRTHCFVSNSFIRKL